MVIHFFIPNLRHLKKMFIRLQEQLHIIKGVKLLAELLQICALTIDIITLTRTFLYYCNEIYYIIDLK